MRINGKEIKNNERMTHSEIQYIHKRIDALIRQLENEGYDVSHGASSHSEANYITINNQTVSFRNHDYFSGVGVADHTVWLSRFDTWTDAKKYFFTDILPVVNGEKIKEEKQEVKRQSNDDLIAEAEKQLASITDPNLRLGLEGRIKRLKAGTTLR